MKREKKETIKRWKYLTEVIGAAIMTMSPVKIMKYPYCNIFALSSIFMEFQLLALHSFARWFCKYFIFRMEQFQFFRVMWQNFRYYCRLCLPFTYETHSQHLKLHTTNFTALELLAGFFVFSLSQHINIYLMKLKHLFLRKYKFY